MGARTTGGLIKSVRHFSLLVLIVVCALLHRNAVADPWADDRSLFGEPTWYQLAAPSWHAALPHSHSLAAMLTAPFAALSDASHAGDARAVASLVTAAVAGTLLALLMHAGVSLSIAVLVTMATTSTVLPVSASTAVAHAVQMLAAAGLLLVWTRPFTSASLRFALMLAVTIIGALNHPSFVAFATGVWVVEIFHASAHRRLALVSGSIALAAALVAGAIILQADLPIAPEGAPTPSLLTLMGALVIGRFPAELQPTPSTSLLPAISLASPLPFVLLMSVTLAAVADRGRRRLGVACLVASACSVIFASGTWLPDPAIATSGARLAGLVLTGLGLSWLRTQPRRGAATVALLVAAFTGGYGFLTANPRLRSPEIAQLQDYTDSAAEYAERWQWTAHSITVTRSLLMQAGDQARSARRAITADVIRAVSESAGVLVLFHEGLTRRLPAGLSIARHDVPHRHPRSFIASQPETRWAAFVVRGNAVGEPCRGLLQETRISPPTPGTDTVAVVHLRRPPVSTTADDQLDVPYGQLLRDDSEVAPVSFRLESRPVPKITINGQTAVMSEAGMIMTIVDSWQGDWYSWVIRDCTRPRLPPIGDRRLRAGFIVNHDGMEPLPDVPAIADEVVEVPLSNEGEAWLASGWHIAEAEPIRWTSSRDAHVNVIAGYSQPLRVSIDAQLAQGTSNDNQLSISWNGVSIPATAPFQGTGEWIIDPSLVHRGLNRLTIHVDALVSPAASGQSQDRRLLGAAVRRLSFAPIPSATKPSSTMAQR